MGNKLCIQDRDYDILTQADIQKENEILSKKVIELERKISYSDKKISDLDKKISDSDKKISDLDKKISDSDKKISDLDKKIYELHVENQILKQYNEDNLHSNRNNFDIDNSHNGLSKNTINRIDKFVEEWYNKNNDTVDIGKYNIPLYGDIDLFPDSAEKHIYKKIIAITLCFIKDTANQIE